jgi:hypothetical protein
LRPQYRYGRPQDLVTAAQERVSYVPSYVPDGSSGQVPYGYQGISQIAGQNRYANPANAAAYGGYVSPVSLKYDCCSNICPRSVSGTSVVTVSIYVFK